MMLILGKLGNQDRALVLLEEAHWNASNSPWPNRFGRGFFGRDAALPRPFGCFWRNGSLSAVRASAVLQSVGYPECVR
jgi:hypothetical protein